MELVSALASDAKKQDRKLFDQLVEKHHKQAYNIAYRMSGNHSDAEDLTQETFIRAYRFFGKYKQDMPFESWLYKIMSRVFIDQLRKRPKMSIRSLDQPVYSGSNEYFIEISDEHYSPEDVLMSKDIDSRIQQALQDMPVVFRMTVVYADIEGLSYEEIAEITGANIGTVRSRLHRGRRILRERLGDLSEIG